VRPHQSSHLHTNTRIRCLRNNSRTFTKQTELFVVPILGVFFLYLYFNFIITILLSLFLLPLLSLFFLCYNPLFSLPTTLSAPLHPLSPHLLLSLLSFPNLSPQYSSLLHTHHLLTSLLYQLYTTQPPSIPKISTLYYNNRNTPKSTKGPKTQDPPIPLSPPNHPFSCPPFLVPTLSVTQVSISSLITITPITHTVCRYYHHGVFYIKCKQLVWH
jgi:hypothetical protein